MSYSDSDSPLSSPPESADEAPPPVSSRHVKPTTTTTTKRPTKKKTKKASNANNSHSNSNPTATITNGGTGNSTASITAASAATATTIPRIKLKAPVRSPSPVLKQRAASPPHVYMLADSPQLAFIVMFRARFADAFKGVPNLGCQDIERGIVDSTPSEQVELLLCRLISLVLNRKKPVELVLFSFFFPVFF